MVEQSAPDKSHKSPTEERLKRAIGNIVSICIVCKSFATGLTGILWRALLRVGDETEAISAFRWQIVGEEGTGGAHCDNCLKAFSATEMRHVCTACIDTDLCDACFQKYNTGDLKQMETELNCVDHQFFTTYPGAAYSELPTVSQWLENLSKRYHPLLTTQNFTTNAFKQGRTDGSMED